MTNNLLEASQGSALCASVGRSFGDGEKYGLVVDIFWQGKPEILQEKVINYKSQ
jgi:hypothetical protein